MKILNEILERVSTHEFEKKLLNEFQNTGLQTSFLNEILTRVYETKILQNLGRSHDLGGLHDLGRLNENCAWVAQPVQGLGEQCGGLHDTGIEVGRPAR